MPYESTVDKKPEIGHYTSVRLNTIELHIELQILYFLDKNVWESINEVLP